jgi:hypothetical protein
VEPDIVYLKLASLVEGARIASERLWSTRSPPLRGAGKVARNVTGSLGS